MGADGRGHIVAASDGSWRSGPVLDVAAEEASIREVALVVVSVVPDARGSRLGVTALLRDAGRMASLTDWRLHEAVSHVRARHPGLALDTRRLTHADLAEGDVDVLRDAALVVIGARGARSHPAITTGTVSSELLRSTRCPVLVVPETAPVQAPGPARAPAPVLAGVGDDALARVVLESAVDYAILRHAPVLALHAYGANGTAPDGDRAQALAYLGRVLAEACRAQRRQHTLVVPVVTPEAPADALVSAASRSSTVVIGRLSSEADGSVGRVVLDTSPQPVLVVEPLPAPVGRP